MKDRNQLAVGSQQSAVSSHNQELPTADCQLPTGKRPHSESGFTLLELIITMTIIVILVAGTVPVANNLIKREKERDLRRNLREIRMAIDSYNIECRLGGWAASPVPHPSVANGETDPDLKCYPKDLETLEKGVLPPNAIDTKRFLRHIPKDPFATPGDDPQNHWETITASDGGLGSSGSHVFDVRSKSQGTALDGTKYRDW